MRPPFSTPAPPKLARLGDCRLPRCPGAPGLPSCLVPLGYRNIIKSRRAYVITLITLIMFPWRRLRAAFMRHSPLFLITFLVSLIIFTWRQMIAAIIRPNQPHPATETQNMLLSDSCAPTAYLPTGACLRSGRDSTSLVGDPPCRDPCSPRTAGKPTLGHLITSAPCHRVTRDTGQRAGNFSDVAHGGRRYRTSASRRGATPTKLRDGFSHEDS
jgi:hypothetical protein